MKERATPAASRRAAAAARRASPVPGPKAGRARNADLPLAALVGNRASLRLMRSGTVQRKLWLKGRGSQLREPSADERKVLIEVAKLGGAVKPGDLDKAEQAGEDFLLSYHGSLYMALKRGSLDGVTLLGISQVVPTPGVAGRGNVTLGPREQKGQWFRIKGRPGWTKEIVELVKTKPGKENIRHIVPYHLIRDAFQRWLDAHSSKGTDAFVKALGELATALQVPQPPKIDEDGQKAVVIAILAKLNNAPGNLWPGDAQENQRLNSFRTMLEKILDKGKSQDEVVDYVATKSQEGDPLLQEMFGSLRTGLDEFLVGHKGGVSNEQFGKFIRWYAAEGEFDVQFDDKDQRIKFPWEQYPQRAKIFQALRTDPVGSFPEAALALLQLKPVL